MCLIFQFRTFSNKIAIKLTPCLKMKRILKYKNDEKQIYVFVYGDNIKLAHAIFQFKKKFPCWKHHELEYICESPHHFKK